MLLEVTKSNIYLNMGTLDIMRSIIKNNEPHAPTLFYDNKHRKMVEVYKNGSTLFIEADNAGICFALDINSRQYSNIKVKIGSIESTAIASIDESYAIKMGAIQLTIGKEEVGDLYMWVKAGTIVVVPSLIKVNPLGETGCLAHYKGELMGQKTELFVESGAILCTIL